MCARRCYLLFETEGNGSLVYEHWQKYIFFYPEKSIFHESKNTAHKWTCVYVLMGLHFFLHVLKVLQ